MRVQEQTTLARAATGFGAALHSGNETRITLRPAPAGSGVVFRRTDLRAPDGARLPDAEIAIPARAAFIADTRLGVRLRNAAGATVMTVEHVLAALMLAGVDNAIVDIDGPEPPGFDGSSAPLIALIEEAGVRRLGAAREAIEVRAPVRIEDGDRFVEAAPAAGRRLDVSIEFPEPAIGRQSAALRLDDPADVARLAAARTFCRLHEVEAMRQAGFGLGGSLNNAIVVDGARILNEEGLRDPNEFALHKALDLLGDLSLLGAPLFGQVRAHKPGHDLNTRLVCRLAAELAAIERRVVPLEGGKSARAIA